jgi:hypothetical protein
MVASKKPVDRDVAALVAFIESRHHKPHAIGCQANECIAFMLGAVEAQTGKKVAARLKWGSLPEAARIIKRYGSLERAIDAFFERIPPAHAMRGDIGGVPDEGFGIHPMIVEGLDLVGPGDDGNRRVKRSAMTVAWSAVLPKPRKRKP